MAQLIVKRLVRAGDIAERRKPEFPSPPLATCLRRVEYPVGSWRVLCAVTVSSSAPSRFSQGHRCAWSSRAATQCGPSDRGGIRL